MIIDYYGYKVSDNGIIEGKRFRKPLKYRLNEYGYYECTIYKNNIKHKISVHRLVAFLFVPGYRKGLQVNHKDGNKLNNKADNLEWVTLQENINHAVCTGLRDKIGIINSQKRRKLSLSQVKDIRNRRLRRRNY